MTPSSGGKQPFEDAPSDPAEREAYFNALREEALESSYTKVWREVQNRDVREQIMTDLHDGHTVQIELQPGDYTRYAFSLTPITSSYRYTVSDDGRKPSGPAHLDRPLGIVAVVLNEGFAERAGFFWSHEFHEAPINAAEVERRIAARNSCTAAALLETLRAAFDGGVIKD